MKAENYKKLKFDSSFFSTQDRDVDYKGLLNKYFLSRWYWYVLCLVTFVGLSHFYCNILEPAYEIRSKLLITEGERDNNLAEDWIKRSLNFSVVSGNVYNEIQVLTSFALLNQVVNYLNLDIHYFWENGLTKRDAYKDFPVVVNSYSLHSWEHLGKPFKIVPLSDQQFEMYNEDEILVGTYSFDKEFSNVYGSFCFEVNGILPFGSEATMHVDFNDPAAVTESYLKSMGVGFIDIKSTTLEIVLEDAVPQRGIDILENVIIRYHELKNHENNRVANNTLQFIDERLVDIGRDLRSIESRVENYKINQNIASETTSDLPIILQNVNQMDKEKDNIQVQLNILESMKQNLNLSSDEFELIPINSSTSNIQIQEVVRPYNDLVLARRQLLVTSQPNNPVVMSKTQQLISLRNSIYSAIKNLQSDLRLQLGRVNTQYDQSMARMRSLPTKQRELLEKDRQQEIVENLYVYLLQKREETALSLIGTSSNSIVIDPPRSSTYAVSPNRIKFYLVGSFAGFALPLLLITIVETFKDSIQSEEDLKALMPHHSIIGMINQAKGKKRQVVLSKTRSLISDRFRSLRTNLQFLGGDQEKSIMVTSSASGEGKTFIATNLAVSFAMTEEKAILVDFDLRNSQVMNYLGEEGDRNIGLSNYFLGQTTKVEDIIQTSSKVANLNYISAGPMPAYPDELVVPEKKLAQLFEYLRAHYDTIIVDTSPVGVISDAILLNKHITQTIYVAKARVTKKEMIEKARELFDNGQLVNPSLVLNGVKRGEVYGYKVK